MANYFLMYSVLSEWELIFIWDFVEILLVLVMETLLVQCFCISAAKHSEGITGMRATFPLINHLGNSCIQWGVCNGPPGLPDLWFHPYSLRTFIPLFRALDGDKSFPVILGWWVSVCSSPFTLCLCKVQVFVIWITGPLSPFSTGLFPACTAVRSYCLCIGSLLPQRNTKLLQ